MSNKTQLQQNNTELQEHLQDILGLPTAAEIAAGASTGQYAWKKYEYTPAETIQVINPKSTLTYYKSDSFKVLSDDYNVNSVDISFFNGFTLAVAKYDQYIINDGYVTINGSNTEVVYDKTNAILTVKGVTYSSSDSGTLNYNGIKTYEKEEKIGGLIGYIVSDSPTAYPNDGVQDGYWYVKIKPVALKGWYMIDSSEGISMVLPYEFYNGSAVVLDNEIHILGGTNHEIRHYKWNGTSWTSVSTLPYNFRYASAVVLNGEIHILGGNDSSTNTNHYKWNGTTWSSVSTLPHNFRNGSAVVLNGEIHILGSDNNATKHYKWNGTSWTSVSTLPYIFVNGSAIVLDNEIHILGSANMYNKTRHYKFDGTSWANVSALPYDFHNGSAVVLNGEIHILGGNDSSTNTNHYKYDGTSWSSVSTLPHNFRNGSAVVLNGEIHILGGNTSVGGYKDHYAYTA